MTPSRNRVVRGSLALIEPAIALLSEAPNSVVHHLNTHEVVRIASLSILVAGCVLAGSSLLFGCTDLTFPSPADSALAAAVFVSILDARRRLSHGQDLWSAAVGSRRSSSQAVRRVSTP